MQKLTIIGNLTHAPETKDTQSGSMVCTFTVAVNAQIKGEKVASFYRVSAWGRLADVCDRYLNKGAKVAVVGDLNARLYEGKDGEKRMSLDVRADEVEFLTAKAEAQAAPAESTDEFTDADSEDCPF